MLKIFHSLIFYVFSSILLGIFCGHYYPTVMQKIIFKNPFHLDIYILNITIKNTFSDFLNSLFISSIKVFINPIIFITVIQGIVSMGSLKKVGKIGGKAFFYFEIATTIALTIGILVTNIIKPGVDVFHNNTVTSNVSFPQKFQFGNGLEIFKILQTNVTLQVLLVSVILGMLLVQYKNKDKIIEKLNTVGNKIFILLKYVMYLAPIGAFGGMASTVSQYGITSLVALAKLMITMYVTMFFYIFGILGLILWFYKENIWYFIKYIKNEILVVIATSSSESSLPSLMHKLEQKGLKKSTVGLVVPMGYSFNLDGTMIYLSMAVIFLTQVYSIHLNIEQMVTIIVVLTVISKGAAAIYGSAFIILTSTIESLQIIPIEGLTLLIGIDRFMAEARAVTNFIGNGVAAIVISKNEERSEAKAYSKSVLTK